MLRAALLLLYFCSTSFFSFSQSAIQSKWLKTPVVIDGISKEWNHPFGFYEAKTQLMFALANNGSHLCLCFQCPNQINQEKIVRAGMKVSISRKGKNKIDASILFPVKDNNVPTATQETDYAEGRSGILGLKAFVLMNHFTVSTTGFATQNGTVPAGSNSGIMTAMNWDSTNTLNYEIAIPFTELFGSNFSAEDFMKELLLSVEIFSLKQPDIENMNISGTNMNNNGSVINGGGMTNYGMQNGYGNSSMGGMGGTSGMNGMNGNNSLYGNGMQNGLQGGAYDPTGMNNMQGNGNTNSFNGYTPPQYKDISSMYQKVEMKQKFLLAGK